MLSRLRTSRGSEPQGTPTPHRAPNALAWKVNPRGVALIQDCAVCGEGIA